MKCCVDDLHWILSSGFDFNGDMKVVTSM